LKARLRPAAPPDVGALVAIKEKLGFEPGTPRPRGGFLLGCSPERYAELIAAGCVLVLEEREEIAGFAITLPDAILRASELWARRSVIRWHEGEGEPPEGEPIAYFDQLALSPEASRLNAAPLALAAVRRLMRGGHRRLYATTLQAPIRNPAALPLLRAFGARAVGQLTEHYEGVGEVVSALHCAPLDAAMAPALDTPAGLRTAVRAEKMAA